MIQFQPTKTTWLYLLFAFWPLPYAYANDTDATPPQSQPTAGLLIEGMVLNHYGGGIAGATIRIESLDASAEDAPLAQGTTNATGDIAIRFPKPASSVVRVRVQKRGYADFVQEVDISDEDEPPFIDATLQGAARLTGTLRAKTTNNPVADALVQCSNGGRNFETRTNANGQYMFYAMCRGPATLTIYADGFGIHRTNIRIEGKQADANINLDREQPVELTVVTNNGVPAADVLVEAFVEPTQTYVSATTNTQGKALVRGIGTDTQALHLRLTGERYVQMAGFDETVPLIGRNAQPTDATAKPAVTTTPAAPTPPPIIAGPVTVTVAAHLRGKVIDATTRKPVVGVRIVAGRQVRYDMPISWTSLDGTYELMGIRPGIVTISFQHNQFATSIHDVDLHTGKTITLNTELQTGRPLAGTVVDEDDNPMDQVRVSADRWKGYATLGLRTITDPAGAFSFDHTPIGNIDFSFVRPGYGPVVQETLTSGKTDYRITLTKAFASTPSPADLPQKIRLGQTVPDLTLTATDGTTLKLSKIRGKYVFLDCWASWCGPCLAEIPNIKALHQATKDRSDFLLIGVSLDTDAQAFKKAVDTHEMTWPQVFGPKSGASEAFIALNGIAIPYTCLIGPDGKLLDQHLRGPSIPAKVKKHLPE